ncbi:MAG TPA: hypothetical protein VJC11_03100 [Patescibacteria group bacterium]|nr:hypothetical protein [Patescibacteria group bacterium]
MSEIETKGQPCPECGYPEGHSSECSQNQQTGKDEETVSSQTSSTGKKLSGVFSVGENLDEVIPPSEELLTLGENVGFDKKGMRGSTRKELSPIVMKKLEMKQIENRFKVIEEKKITPGVKVRNKEGAVYVVQSVQKDGCLRLEGVKGSFGPTSLEVIEVKD